MIIEVKDYMVNVPQRSFQQRKEGRIISCQHSKEKQSLKLLKNNYNNYPPVYSPPQMLVNQGPQGHHKCFSPSFTPNYNYQHVIQQVGSPKE